MMFTGTTLPKAFNKIYGQPWLMGCFDPDN